MKAPSQADINFQEAVQKHQQGDLPRAAVLYRKVLARAPAHPDALQLLGLIEAQAGKLEIAADLLGRSVRIRPNDPGTWINYGNVLLELQRPAEALVAYDRAIGMQAPAYAALLNRGNALRDLGRPEDALASYDEALRAEPENADALCNRGNALRDLNRIEEAINSYDRALAASEMHADALCNRGAARRDIGQLADAGADLEKALAINPAHKIALNNLGDVLAELGRHADAAAVFDRLRAIDPDFDYLAGYAHHARLRACDWSDFDKRTQALLDAVRKGRPAAVPFSFLAVSDLPQDQLRCAQIHAGHRYPPRPPLWTGERYGHDRIRLAYLSAEFHDHATMRLAAGLFERHDRELFEVAALSYGPEREDAMRARVRGAFDQFIDVRGRSDREIAQTLRDMEIDIAIDLKGYTQEARPGILALRPAPVQVSYLGFPGTLGAAYVDYVIADRIVIPPADACHYAEKVVYLPDTYQVNDRDRKIGRDVPTRAQAGLPERGFVFCCFNNSFKITPRVFDVWMRLLRQVDSSVLWLYEDNADAARNLRAEAVRRGIAEDRLVFAARAAPDEHLARHALADLCLDTLPYNAHTTASDALWAGLPVLTCAGTTFAGRVAASLLQAVGMSELITSDLAAYEARVLALARNPGELDTIRAKLKANIRTHPLFDTDRFTRHMETAFVSMWERAERAEPPESFAVEAIEGAPRS